MPLIKRVIDENGESADVEMTPEEEAEFLASLQEPNDTKDAAGQP